MAIDPALPHTRRALLAAALGAGVATVASALGRPQSADAADGGAVILGQDNQHTIFTSITNSQTPGTHAAFAAPGTYALLGQNDAAGAPAVNGTTSGQDGMAVLGEVQGSASGAIGVLGTTGGDASQYGVRGVAQPVGIAVHGKAQNGTGVLGEATGGYGVYGTTSGGRGVFGQATSGIGVRGYATSGTGLSGEATTGYALRTTGRVRLDKSAGLATVPAATNHVTVTPGIDLTTTSAVVATLQASAGGTTTVHRVVVNATANTFTVYLTANATASVKVAWIVLG